MIEAARALPPALRAAWVLALGTLLALGLGSPLVVPRIVLATRLPVADPWTPGPLQHPATFGLCLLAVLATALGAVVVPGRATARLFGWTTLLAGAVALVHQLGHGWAGSVLLFWTGAWGVWLAHVRDAVDRGPFLCLLLLGGVFAFPAVGKATPGFLDGTVYWDLQWSHGVGIHGWLAGVLGAERHRALAGWFGPFTVVAEGVLAFVWLMPARVGFGAIGLAAAGLLITSGVEFLDAMGLLVALAASGAALAEDRRTYGEAGVTATS